MNVGIICEYNPFHYGHEAHIKETKRLLGGQCAVICVMSGNFVQRGDFAVYNKHARAEAAVRSGADLVIELPTPYALCSAEGFARAGVFLLDSLGVCDFISFGSETGSIEMLEEAAKALVLPEAASIMRKWLEQGLPYALARQKAADELMGARSQVLKKPNNLLGIEYLIAISSLKSGLTPITVARTGGEHDGVSGYSASAVRGMLLSGILNGGAQSMPGGTSGQSALLDKGGELSLRVPHTALGVYENETAEGRGPVSIKHCELAILSRLREMDDYSKLPGVSEGLEHRFLKYSRQEATVAAILDKVKSKRYVMSRLRRMLLCACLNITADDCAELPPYIRVLAMNSSGMKVLKEARKKAKLPIITKPASARGLGAQAVNLFCKEAVATDFYVLAYTGEKHRRGGSEWQTSPIVSQHLSGS